MKRNRDDILYPIDFYLHTTGLLITITLLLIFPQVIRDNLQGFSRGLVGQVQQQAQAAVTQAKQAVVQAPGNFAGSASRAVTRRLPEWVPGSTNTSNAIKDPNVRAALDTIARAEGVKHGYNTLIGNTRVSDLSKHPQICVPFGRGGQCSTAFGRYQFLNKTWSGLMGNQAMTPANQDKAAILLIRKCGVLDDIKRGDPNWVNNGCIGRTWASFPQNNYGQKRYGASTLTSWFKSYQQKNGAK